MKYQHQCPLKTCDGHSGYNDYIFGKVDAWYKNKLDPDLHSNFWSMAESLERIHQGLESIWLEKNVKMILPNLPDMPTRKCPVD